MRVLGEGVPLCSLLSHLALPGHSCDWADTPPEASLKTKFFAGKWKEFPHSLTRLWLVLKARDHRPGWAGTQGNPSQKKRPRSFVTLLQARMEEREKPLLHTCGMSVQARSIPYQKQTNKQTARDNPEASTRETGAKQVLARYTGYPLPF